MPDRFGFDYATTCDALEDRQDDPACAQRPLDWLPLTTELCAGRPIIASLRARGSVAGAYGRGQGVLQLGPTRRVLVVDPARLCPAGRDCEGELDEGFWLTYDEYAAGWGGLEHWVDFYGIRRR